jgi:integrator complex subunit 10
VTIKCWALLHSVVFEHEFAKLFQQWSAHNWSWLNDFEVDMHIHQGSYREAISKLQVLYRDSVRDATSAKYYELQVNLQMASCYCGLLDYTNAVRTILYVVGLLQWRNPAPSIISHPDQSSGVKGRQLQIISLNDSEILAFCVHTIIACLKNKAMIAIIPEDSLLGHMIVFMQYDWPKYEQLFCDVIKLIKHKGTLNYLSFFTYVINIDMLEEFAYLRTPQGGNVNLNVLSINPMTALQARTVTRGVNKGVSEDFRTAIERQVTRCNENIEKLLARFFIDESNLILNSVTG